MIDQRDIEQFCDAAYRCVAADVDLNIDDAYAVKDALAALLEHCEAEIGTEDESRYTLTLLDYWICFAQDYGVPGGSKADYCSEAVRQALRETWGSATLRVADDEVLDILRGWVDSHALDPEYQIGILMANGVL